MADRPLREHVTLAEHRDLVRAYELLLARVEKVESRFRSGMHGLGWDSVRWVGPRDVAAVFGVTTETVRSWCRRGVIPHTNLRTGLFKARYRIPAFWLMTLPELERQKAAVTHKAKPKRAPGDRNPIWDIIDRKRRERAEKARVLALAAQPKRR